MSIAEIAPRKIARIKYQPSRGLNRSVLLMRRSLNRGQLKLKNMTAIIPSQMSVEYGTEWLSESRLSVRRSPQTIRSQDSAPGSELLNTRDGGCVNNS